MRDILGGPVVKNPYSAGAQVRFLVQEGKPHLLRSNQAPVPQPLSLCSATREATATRIPPNATREQSPLPKTRESPYSDTQQ